MRALVLALSTAVLAACQGVPGDGVRTQPAPPRDTFTPVADVLASGCGSLDCHGQPGRNFRLYSQNGLRLAKDAVSGQGATTDAEYDTDYTSVISIEPDILANVAHEHDGAERLTLVRKARGEEHHKGNTVFEPDSDADRCLVSWLTDDKVDAELCASAADLVSPFEPP